LLIFEHTWLCILLVILTVHCVNVQIYLSGGDLSQMR